MTNAGAELVWNIYKGDYSGTSAVTIPLGPTRIEQVGIKDLMIESWQDAPETISTDASKPLNLVMDTGKGQQSFKIYGILVNSGTDYAYDLKNKIVSAYEGSRTGSLNIVQFSTCSGTNTGSESFIVNVNNYSFIHESPGVDKVSYQLGLIVGSELV